MKFIKNHRPEILIALMGILTYVISLVNTFHSDDWVVLSLLRDGFSWSDFLSMENTGRFRPLTNLFVFLRYLAFGDWATGYYAVNIILHASFAVLLYRFLLKIGIGQKISFLAATIFAAYFQHYEAVLWLYGTIRILAAIFWVLSLWTLHNYLISGKGKALLLFAVTAFLAYFVVEDMVILPLGALIFGSIFAMKNPDENSAGSGISRKRIWRAVLVSLAGVAVYFILRTALIVRPGIVEIHYYFGLHIFSKLFEYLQWIVLPPPDHLYFQPIASRLSPVLFWTWKIKSIALTAAVILACIYALFKGSKVTRFMILFMVIALLPALPLDYKVTSRNVYIPSIGYCVLTALLLWWTYDRIGRRKVWRIVSYAFISAYLVGNVAAVWVTSHEYRKNQTLVESLVNDIKNSRVDLSKYDYVLLDHLPGRTVIGPAMVYKLGFSFSKEVIASNDPSAPGPNDIRVAARDIESKGYSFVVFDYKEGHLRESTADYIESGH